MKSKISLIFFLIFSVTPFPQENLKVLSSNRNSITLEFTPNFTISNEQINNETFIKVGFPLASTLNPESAGSPSIPARQIPIGVPSEFGNTIEILSTSVKEIEGKIVPVPIPIKDGGLNSFKYEINEKYFFSPPVDQVISFGEFAIIRGMPVQYLLIKPVLFSTAGNKIKLYTKVVFKINYSANQNNIIPAKDNFLENVIPNFNVAKSWIRGKKDKVLNKTLLESSVLSTGKWIRFETKEEGIYKINRSTLASFGIDPNVVDPRTIKIYNNSGKVLPEIVNSPRPNDLVENAIIVSGEADGTFDTDDYILFYGRGTNFWDYDINAHTVKRYFHPYSTSNFYWITYGGSNGKRIQEKPSENSSIKYDQQSTLAFANWEEDKINIGKTGRIYLGDDFTQSVSSRTYINKLDGRIENSQINYTFRLINASSGSIVFAAEENGTQFFSQVINGYGTYPYSYGTVQVKNALFNGTLSDSRSVIKLKFTPTAATSIGYLDFFEVKYEKDLKAYEDNLLFFSKDTSSIIEYDLSGFTSTNIRVFDVSDYSEIKIITNPIVQSGSEFRFQSVEAAGNVSKYFAVGSDKFKTPINPVVVSNQNLHGYSDGGKLIIIYNKNLKDQAIRLKNYRENNAKLNISAMAVDIDEIYNEFSGGLLDVTAVRDFVRFAYENWTVKPEYVLLFGDGTYDYKNLEKNSDNMIPVYETVESLDEIYSYSMDDYFARVDGNDSRVDIAIGRLNVSSSSEAKNVVDKIIDYENNQEKGIWRNLITLVADDNLTTGGPDAAPNTPQSESLANNVIPESFDINKIYLAAYPTVLTALGRTKPGVFDEIINSVNRGTLIMNYIGHGSPELWAHERVFVKSVTIPLMHNDKYFFLTAATCDFGYYDIPGVQSATEDLITKESSGAIGVFSASRPVYSNQNSYLNEAFFSSLLSTQRDTLNLPITIGKAYMKAKLVGSGDVQNDNKYHLFGDPSLRLNIPQYLANFDSINGQNLSGDVQIKALSNTQIEGVIKKSATTNWDDFNGEGTLTVFDSKRQVKLDPLSTPTNPYYMSVQGGIIFRGRISIIDGHFSSNFVVPKDISYENTNGKIIIYFSSQQEDGLGYTTKIKIGGTDSSTVNDNKGPELEIHFDDATTENTALVNPNSVLVVKLRDETGINTTGTGVGHKLEGILNENFNSPIDFTNFFTGDLNAGGKTGSIHYEFNNLEPGDYKMQVKAWDVFNNPSSELIYFTVVSGNDLFISDVYNYPNPFVSNTTFTFQKNNVNSPVDVIIKIYSVAGRLLRNLEARNLTDNFIKIDWDGRDQDGNPIANGAYLYNLIVKSTDGTFNKNVLGKLAILR